MSRPKDFQNFSPLLIRGEDRIQLNNNNNRVQVILQGNFEVLKGKQQSFAHV